MLSTVLYLMLYFIWCLSFKKCFIKKHYKLYFFICGKFWRLQTVKQYTITYHSTLKKKQLQLHHTTASMLSSFSKVMNLNNHFVSLQLAPKNLLGLNCKWMVEQSTTLVWERVIFSNYFFIPRETVSLELLAWRECSILQTSPILKRGNL